MKNDKAYFIFTAISFIISLSLTIFNIFVLVQYFNHNTNLLTLSCILNIFELIFISKGKGLATLIPLTIGSFIALKDFWHALCFALLIENVFSGIFGIFIWLYLSLFKNDYNN